MGVRTLAAELLREPGATVGSVARQVGYLRRYALSTAVKRVRGDHSATASDLRPTAEGE